MREFPPRASQPAPDVVRIGYNFIFLGKTIVSSPEISPVIGRPPLKWDEFNVEITRRILEDALPAKQCAFRRS